ncbi:hypothetical protein ACFVW5_35465 [Streptomyces sp. NPDC058232]|uniref:hypothetical protein n=1 Tax=unclassified Streptomyces TaxID=2593676 RepID=UPI0036A68AA9
MGSLTGELAARQSAVRARVEELEGEVAVFTSLLEAERERLERLTVTQETLEELAADGVRVDETPQPQAGPVGGGRAAGGLGMEEVPS